MKKSLLTFALASITTATFAQAPDASSWKAGDDITDKIAWGNLNFTHDPMDFWTSVSASGGPNNTNGLFEIYDGSECDLFQYVLLPKGQYRLECQGYYRFGGSGDEYKSYEDGTYEDNALLYVQDGTYNPTTKDFTPGSLRFENPLMPRLFEKHQDKIYTMPEGLEGWDMSDASYTINGEGLWGPCSVPGSVLWFEAGLYKPYSNGDVTYNQVSFIVTSESYVRLGVTKKAQKSQDSFMATNFKMIYEGEIGDGAEFIAKRQAASTLDANLKNKGLFINDNYEGVFMDLLLTYAEDNYVNTSKLQTLEQCDATIAKLTEVLANIEKYEQNYASVVSLMKQANLLNDKTEYPGKEAFAKIIAKGNDLVDPDCDSDAYTLEDYSTFATELAEARMAYVMSQNTEDGSYDFTFAISYPFFCNPEFEPTYDEVNKVWVPNQASIDAGWGNFDDCDGTFAGATKDYEGVSYNLPAIASEVTISGNTSVKNAWFNERTEGGSLSVYWNDLLPCAKKWDMPHTNGYNRTCQVVTNIPNGYYKLKALAQTWMNDWSDSSPCKIHIFIQAGEQKSMSPYLEPGGWWGKDINQWKELETQMIYVGNNEVLIAGEDNGFATFTGFRLVYYGEHPDFSKQLDEQLASVRGAIEGLRLMGDKAKASELLAKMPETIDSPELFQQAVSVLDEVQAYINVVTKSTDEFEKLISSLDELILNYPGFAAIQDEAFRVSNIEQEGLTYLDELPVKEVYEAMKDYYDFYETIYDEVEESADLKATFNRHEVDFKEYCTVEKINKNLSELSTASHKAYFAANVKDASESNPVDITSLIVNPDFSNGKSDGWKAEGITVDGSFHNAEFYNTAFDMRQTIVGLPAGCYVVKVQGFYRAGGGYSKEDYYKFNNDALGDPELWEDANVSLFANENSAKITSYASQYLTERGMTKSFTGGYDGEEMIFKPMEEVDNPNGYPWDTPIDIDDYDPETFDPVKLWYANSREGAFQRFEKSPEAYINEVAVMVEDGGNLTFGLTKSKKVSNDWMIFDNWKLYYLGAETPLAVESVNASSNDAKEFFNAAGIRTNGMNKGINIVKMADGSVKKIIK